MAYLNISINEPLTKKHRHLVKEYQLGPNQLQEGSYFVSELPCYLNNKLSLVEFPTSPVDIQFLTSDGNICRDQITSSILVNPLHLTDIPKYEVINKEIELEDIDLEANDLERE